VTDPLYSAEQGLLVEVLAQAERAAIVVEARGELDSQTVPELDVAVNDALSRTGTRRIVLDLTEIVFFGSAGVAFLTQADAQARAHSIELRLVVPPTSRVHRVLDVMGLIRLMALYPTQDEAALIVEHPFLDEYSHISGNPPVLGYLAAKTSRMHLLSGS
jgi:anti-anti-sigma factor